VDRRGSTDAWEQTEFEFARLRYRSNRDGCGYYRSRWESTPTNPTASSSWPRRLSRIHARSVEQIVDIAGDDLYDWPWLYAVGIGDWTLSDEHVRRLRNFFNRGGFLMVDDFHNEREWASFMAGVNRINHLSSASRAGRTLSTAIRRTRRRGATLKRFSTKGAW
jgi:hypothetical protein